MQKTIFIVLTVATMFTVGSASQKLTRNLWFNSSLPLPNNNICQDAANNTAVPNEASCTEFFICVDGSATPNTCPPGQWFNPDNLECDSSENLDCNPSNEFQCPEDGVHFFPHDDYCDKYIICFGGVPVVFRCAEGFYFDRELLTCNFPEYAECELELCPPYNDPDNMTFIASDVDCEKYYICFDGKPIELRCAPGIHFNPVNNLCDFPENANCTIERPDDGPTFPEPQEIDCEGDGLFFVEHPNSCEFYFICSERLSHLLQCAPETFFDPINCWCDSIENVQCDANGGDSNDPPPGTGAPFNGTHSEENVKPIVPLVVLLN